MGAYGGLWGTMSPIVSPIESPIESPIVLVSFLAPLVRVPPSPPLLRSGRVRPTPLRPALGARTIRTIHDTPDGQERVPTTAGAGQSHPEVRASGPALSPLHALLSLVPGSAARAAAHSPPAPAPADDVTPPARVVHASAGAEASQHLQPLEAEGPGQGLDDAMGGREATIDGDIGADVLDSDRPRCAAPAAEHSPSPPRAALVGNASLQDRAGQVERHLDEEGRRSAAAAGGSGELGSLSKWTCRHLALC